MLSVGRSCSPPDTAVGEADFSPGFFPWGCGVVQLVALQAVLARLCWWAAGQGCPCAQSHLPSSTAQPGAVCPSLVPLHGAHGTSPHPLTWWDSLGRGDTDTPGAGCPRNLERLRSGVYPSKQFWIVGWLPRSKAKCRVCRKQAGGTACLSFEWKTRSEEQNPTLEGSL